MPNTYTQMYVQLVFAVKNRQALIPKEHKEELHKYIAGIVTKRHQKLLAIHAMPDHIHIFIGFKPTVIISDIVRDIKTTSSQFIKEKQFTKFQFNWQKGYGAFTYAHSQLGIVCRYIENQEEYHRKKTFRAEYLDFLEKFDVDYDDQYLFDFLD
ncbi:MAG: IS200/IS605 family transposase [Saprospiraceae bacterium]